MTPSSPEHVHPQQPLLQVEGVVAEPVPHGLVAHGHPALVDAHLGAPHPRRLAQHARVGHGGTKGDKS